MPIRLGPFSTRITSIFAAMIPSLAVMVLVNPVLASDPNGGPASMSGPAAPETAAGSAIAAETTAGGPTPVITPTGDSTATAPPVDELIRLALSRSPSVASLRARLESARQMAKAPGLPNPMLEVMAQDENFPKWTVGEMEMSMVQIGVTQSFPPFGRIAAQRAAGRADSDVRAAELEAAQRETIAEVRRLYGQLYALDRERDALESGLALVQTISGAAADRYGAGKADQEAVLKAQLSTTRLMERRNDLDSERAAAVAALNEILDRPGTDPMGRVTHLPEIQVPDSAWEDLAVRLSPEVRSRRAAVQAAERRVSLARTGYRPELSAGGDVGLRGRLDPVVSFRMGVGLPLWGTHRTRYEVQAAQAELQMAREDEREAEAKARSAVARLGGEWKRSEEQVRLFREALVPQSQAALDAARSSFLSDRSDFSTVVEDFQMWLDARAQLASREAERFGTWAELQSLVSVPAAGQGAQ